MKELKPKLAAILAADTSINNILQQVCELLDKEKAHFNWTGFYFKNGDEDELVLGPFVGAATDHVKIPYGKGICGQVAVSGETFVVPDVAQESNYLACSIATKAEIVVPIYKEGKNIGQIDIDSHQANSFTEEDRFLLEWLCGEIGKQL